MKPQDGLDRLLTDVLLDDKLAALRASVRADAHSELVRRRRRPQRWILLPAAAAILLAMLKLFVWTSDVDTTPASPVAAQKTWFLETAPLAAHQLVTTPASGTTVSVVRTESHVGLGVSTRPSKVAVMAIPSRPVDHVDDQELLAMFPGAQRGLIEMDEGRKELKFFDPADEARFLARLD
jgi:hypothetical protein